jgi:hypothetical protein
MINNVFRTLAGPAVQYMDVISIEVISVIQYRNWIYISCRHNLHSSFNADKFTGASMNAATTATDTTSSGLNSESAVRHIFRTICAEMRRAVELAVGAYGQGFAPPL